MSNKGDGQTDCHPPEPCGLGLDIGRLSAGERKILDLLAQGHTAKSIAAELQLTVSLVDQRLREARRKTGFTSSRALARAWRQANGGPTEVFPESTCVAHPKNSAEFFGIDDRRLAPLPVDGVTPPTSAGMSGADAGRKTGWQEKRTMVIIAITSAFGAAIGAVAALWTMTATPSTPVEAAPAPRVIATRPESGTSVPGGKMTLSVTFDQPMARTGYSFVVLSDLPFPDCPAPPVQSRDGRSFSITCTVEPGRRYGVGFNNGRFRNFRSIGGVAAVPAHLIFSTR